MSGKVREKSRNLIMTGEWQPCVPNVTKRSVRRQCK